LPSNDGRGYVLRRILRRAVRFGRSLGIEEAFLFKIVDVVADIMQEAYPELDEKRDFIKEVIKLEEERFLITLNEGIKRVDEIIKAIKNQGGSVIPGHDAFMLYDTFGFPLDLTEDMAEENNFTVDKAGFNSMMEEQRNRAREANKGDDVFAQEKIISELLAGIKPTMFTGYNKMVEDSIVLAIIKDGMLKDSSREEDIMVVTASTPFYAESGGQTADSGVIKGADGSLEVKDVQKVSGWTIHFGSLKGLLNKGEKVSLEVDWQKRLDTARNHTATHLLHKALRLTLGEHAQQKGSLVEPNRLRFDFSHLASLSDNELEKIEQIVNDAVWQMYKVSTTVTNIDKARELGAIALFGEKYDEEVRIVQIEDFSLELCGGTHVDNTGQIGLFKVLSEGSVGSGLRRIEAVTGRHVVNYFKQMERQLKHMASSLRTSPSDVNSRLDALIKNLKDKEKEIEGLKIQFSRASGDDLLNKAYTINGSNILVEVVPNMDANLLRQNAEMLKDKLGSAVILLSSVLNDRVLLVCFVSKDLIAKGLHAGKIIGTAAQVAGGGGGGRPDMAQAGAKDASKLNEALETARNMVKKTLL
jgi:alanyl-tRNA synthetase